MSASSAVGQPGQSKQTPHNAVRKENTLHKSALKVIGVLLVFLAGMGIGAGGLWLFLQFDTELRYAFQEPTMGETPQAKVVAFVQAIHQDDRSAALALWELGESSTLAKDGALKERRERITTELLSAEHDTEYTILGIEWWTTCCEHTVTCDSRNAGGARINVQFLDNSGLSVPYTFDVFAREQPYWGSAMDYPPRHWVIRDVYPTNQEPLYWPRVLETQVRSLEY